MQDDDQRRKPGARQLRGERPCHAIDVDPLGQRGAGAKRKRAD
jgi:hypothetical protein